jgi:hypothetical protein
MLESEARPLSRPSGAEPGRLALGLPGRPGWRGELWILVFFALAACLLAWPIPLSLGSASGLRGDYFNNLWNAWWVRDSLLHGHSPLWTDNLYFPEGISLRRHTLSPLNSLAQAALGGLGGHRAFNLVLLAHFALSGWCFSLFARHVTGSTAGGLLGGLVYSFCPFHYFYLCQINVFSFEFLPLALLFFVKYFRSGARLDLAGLVLALVGMTSSAEYFVVYSYLAFGLLCACARAWAPEVRLATGLRRVLAAGALGALAVALAALPLLYATLGPEKGAETGTAAFSFQKNRTNDLLGFYWLAPKEESIVSWPTMLGYSTLALIALGLRRVLRLWPWLLIGLFFLLLSLGESLVVGGRDTGFPLLYALFGELPVLSMLRKSDRAFMMVQLVASLALAAAFPAVLARRFAPRVRGAAWLLAAALLMLELGGMPFGRFEYPVSPHLRELAGQRDVRAVMELPPSMTHVANGRYDYLQTLHEKKSTLGYTTALAVTPFHDRRIEEIVNAYWEFLFERADTLPHLAAHLGVDRILHYKSMPVARRRDRSIDGRILWAPFCLVKEPLVRVRQLGEFEELPLTRSFGEVVHQVVPKLASFLPEERMGQPFVDLVRARFTRACGPPLFEDEHVLVFAVPRKP